MECASNLVTNLGIMNQEVLLSLLQILQLKMVDLSPTIQEAAVKAAGDLLLSGKEIRDISISLCSISCETSVRLLCVGKK